MLARGRTEQFAVVLSSFVSWKISRFVIPRLCQPYSSAVDKMMMSWYYFVVWEVYVYLSKNAIIALSPCLGQEILLSKVWRWWGFFFWHSSIMVWRSFLACLAPVFSRVDGIAGDFNCIKCCWKQKNIWKVGKKWLPLANSAADVSFWLNLGTRICNCCCFSSVLCIFVLELCLVGAFRIASQYSAATSSLLCK